MTKKYLPLSGRERGRAVGGVLPSGAGGPGQESVEEELTVGQRRQFAHVGYALGQVEHGGAAAQQCLETRAAALPASSLSKARNTRGQPRRASDRRSTPWVPNAAQAG